MPAIPLPFVITLLLLLLAAQLPREKGQTAGPAVAFLSFCALMAACVGLRWHYQWPAMAMVQPVLAVLLPSLLWLCFTQMIGYAASGRWLSGLPVGLLPVLMFGPAGLQQGIDVLISLSYLGHAALLFRLSRRSSDDFSRVMLSQAQSVPGLCLGAGGFLLLSVVTDVAITLDARLSQGQYLIWILTVSQSLIVTGLSYAITAVSRITAEAEPRLEQLSLEQGENGRTGSDGGRDRVAVTAIADTPAKDAPDPSAAVAKPSTTNGGEDDLRIMHRLTTLLQAQTLYLDPNLTLAQLARKAGIPARQISAAVNRQCGLNVSQWINQYRIDKARQLLKETDFSITEIYGMAGFNTKSNFNREFSRITAMTPSAYRRSAD